MNWADFSRQRGVCINNEFDQAMWVARIHREALESAICAFLHDDIVIETRERDALKTRLKQAIDAYLQHDEQYGTPPNLFSERLMSFIREPERVYVVYLLNGKTREVKAVNAATARHEAMVDELNESGVFTSCNDWIERYVALSKVTTAAVK